ncbi:glycosyltransferase family 4 protein [Methylobacterium sp. CM6247]
MTRQMEAGLTNIGIKSVVLDPRGEGSFFKSFYNFPIAMARFLSFLFKNNNCVVHVQISERVSFLREGIFVVLANYLNKRVIIHHHGAEFNLFINKSGKIWRAIVRIVTSKADKNIVLGQPWYDTLTEKLSIRSDRIAIVRNAISGIQDVERPQALNDSPRKITTILLLANLSPRKGVGEALRAMQQLVKDGKDIQLTLAGGGMISYYTQMAASLQISEKCKFLGWVGRDDVADLLQKSDILLMPSYNEGFPVSILEAFWAGVPVIATPVGAIPESVSDNVECILVPVGDVNAIADSITRLIEDPVLCKELAKNARLKVRNELNFDVMFSKLLKIWGDHEDEAIARKI